MNSENLKILTNIIGAVESGGQVYGQRNYADYAGPYKNSPGEHTVTLGWAQYYGDEGQELIQRIKDRDPATFEKYDDGSIAKALKKNWVNSRWDPTGAEKAILINLITSETGKKIQDEMFMELMTQFIADCDADYSSDPAVEMMYCEIRHLGGKKSADRIFKRINGSINLETIMASLVKDQNDNSSNNQVGDTRYWSRHVKCSQWIQSYVIDAGNNQNEGKSDTAMATSKSKTKTDKAIEWMENTANDSSHGYDQDYRWGEKGDYDCSAAVITAWESAGVPVRSRAGADYTGDMKNAFLKSGFTNVTSQVDFESGSGLKRGDVLLRENKHTAMYCGGGKEVEASINEKGTAHGGTPGDQTGKEFLIRDYRGSYWANGGIVLRYKEDATTSTGSSSSSTSTNLKKGSSGSEVKAMQKKLINCGFSCGPDGADGDFGSNTESALKKFQKYAGLKVSGEYGPKAKKRLTQEEVELSGYTRYLAVTDKPLNFRSEPAVGQNVIDQIGDGDTLVYLNYREGKWYNMAYNGKIGYVSKNYIKKK